jgi:hypothetical protein
MIKTVLLGAENYMKHLPRPKLPEPALFDTAVKPWTPFRLERAVINVSVVIIKYTSLTLADD